MKDEVTSVVGEREEEMHETDAAASELPSNVMDSDVKDDDDDDSYVLRSMFSNDSNVVCHEMFRGTCEVTVDELSGTSHKCDQQSDRTDGLSNVPHTSDVDMLADRNTDTDCEMFRCACVVERLQEVDVVECKHIIETHDQMINKSISITANTAAKSVSLRANTADKAHRCNQCRKTFHNRSNLKRHKLLHTGVKPYVSTCDQMANKSVSLRANTADKAHRCVECHKTFHNRSNLKRHKLLHTGVKPYVSTRDQMANKSINITANTALKIHRCDDCHKMFHNRSNLKRHKRTHTGVKPHVSTRDQMANKYINITANTAMKTHRCDYCHKTFHNRSNLKRHQLAHTSVKPYVSTRGQMANKTINITANTAMKIHRCDDCHKRFHNRSNLKRQTHTHRC